MSLYLIAEIGINHNGSLENALKLIDAAADAGFDAVKFQKRTIDKVYSKEMLDGPRESPWGTTQRDQKMGLEFGQEQYQAIAGHCEERGIDWSASAWDVDSQSFIRSFNPAFNKIASPMLGHKPFVRQIAAEQKRTFISTGMATLDEIDEVVSVFTRAQCPFELMHCVSTYPMKQEDANLLCIPMLMARYNCKVGYSGHETSLLKVCIVAVTLGATSIERHITLDRAMYGSDQAASLEVHALRDFVSTMRRLPSLMGTGKKEIVDAELAVRKKLRVEVQG